MYLHIYRVVKNQTVQNYFFQLNIVDNNNFSSNVIKSIQNEVLEFNIVSLVKILFFK